MIACKASDLRSQPGLADLANHLAIPVIDTSSSLGDKVSYWLGFENGALSLLPANRHKGGALNVDFNKSSLGFRRQQSGIRQPLARAVGCKPGYRPTVLDATAGMATDAFILASLGCKMILIEQEPLVHALLDDGLKRAMLLDNDVRSIVSGFMHLQPCCNAVDVIGCEQVAADVVYLDPMFPERRKSAKVKKTMQYLQDVVNMDNQQTDALFVVAKKTAGKRVVVKRPVTEAPLCDDAPAYSVPGKTVRFDVYLC